MIQAAFIVMSIAFAMWQGGAGYKVETRYPVPGNGGFDYVTIDSAARRLYLSHGTQVDVIDPDNGKLIGNTIPLQDCIAWIGQGPISDRTREHLATSDRGVALYHKMLFEECAKVEQGLEPMAVIRDCTENEPMIEIKREGATLKAFDSKYENTFQAIQKEPAPAK